MKKFLFLNFFLLFSISQGILAQSDSLFSNIIFTTNTETFSLQKNSIIYQNEQLIFLKVNHNKEFVTITCYPKFNNSRKIELVPSEDYQIIDSLKLLTNGSYSAKLLLHGLLYHMHPVLSFSVVDKANNESTYRFGILPLFNTTISYPEEVTEMLQEEEKAIEIPAEAAFNIVAEDLWITTEDYDYKVSNNEGKLLVTIKPHTLGYKNLQLVLKTIKPVMNENREIVQRLPPLKISFNVKPNVLYFINADKRTIYLDPAFKTFQEIQIDYNRNISLKKAYRIEDEQEGEGNLVAELYTIALIENSSKIICRVKPYSIHKVSDGYLYLKEGARARFLTNFNILEKPKIDKINVMHEGQGWNNNLSVHPGESIDLKIEGKGLDNATFSFEGCEFKKDTTKYSDEIVFYHLDIPMDISKKVVSVIMNKNPTAYDLYVSELQRPATFEFISINYGANNIALTSDKLTKPIFYDKAINDITFIFNPSKIDDKNKLYGKQYIDVQVKIFNSRQDLVEIQDLPQKIVCPGENSPRHAFYDLKDCNTIPISLNEYLLHKTYKLEAFTQIEITVKHSANVISKGSIKKIRLILTREIHFDIQVSIPAGLLIKRFNESGYGNLYGISMAILAQFNFYSPKVIGKLKPYSIGGGFIALNAFNFNAASTNPRDVGIVVLGSVQPVKTGSKFNIPIYAGGGYLLNAGTFFILFGPGIQFNF